MKDIIEHISTLAKRKVGECESPSCGRWMEGYRYRDYIGGDVYKPESYSHPCPDCADLRKLAEMCMFEHLRHCNVEGCCADCVIGDGQESLDGQFCIEGEVFKSHSTPPTPDIPTLRSYIETLEIWEKFLGYIFNRDAIKGLLTCNTFTMPEGIADILTSAEFYTVLAEFLTKEVVG